MQKMDLAKRWMKLLMNYGMDKKSKLLLTNEFLYGIMTPNNFLTVF